MNRFDVQVLQRFARLVERYPHHQALLDDYVRAHLSAHASRIVGVAQEGEGALVRALSAIVDNPPSIDVLDAIVNAIPARTVSMHKLGATCLQRLLQDAVTDEDYQLSGQRMAMLAGRWRELGIPHQARAMLEDLIETEAFDSLAPMVQVQLYINLGTATGDLGDDRRSLECHRHALTLLERIVPHDAIWHKYLSTTLSNAAAAALRVDDAAEAERFLDQNDEVLPQVKDSGVVLRNHLLRFVWLWNTGQFELALQLGMAIEQDALDYEELHEQDFAELVASTLINLGSLLMEVSRTEEARPRIEKAVALRERIASTTGTLQARLNLGIARVGRIEAAVQANDIDVAGEAGAIVQAIRRIKSDQTSEFIDEVLVRALQAKIKAVLIEANVTLDEGDVTELLSLSTANLSRGGSAEINTHVRTLHAVSMAFAQRGDQTRSLKLAREALRFAEGAPDAETMQSRAQRAALYDGLSRRLSALGDEAASIDEAERALSLVVSAWQENPSAYAGWLQQILERYLMLCGDAEQLSRFQRTCQTLKLDVEIAS